MCKLWLCLSFIIFAPDFSRDVAKGKDEKPKVQIVEREVDISGYYACKGTEGTGKPYDGVVVIKKRDETYIVQWIIGGSSFTGVGILQDNTFSVGWAISGKDGKGNDIIIRGVNVYRIESERLVGRWATLPGEDILKRETLTFLKKLEGK